MMPLCSRLQRPASRAYERTGNAGVQTSEGMAPPHQGATCLV